MLTLAPRGAFMLAASSRFLEDFAPAGREAGTADGPLRLVFPPDGRVDGARLRAMSAEEAIADVGELPGIGPSETRLHDSMRELYALPGVDVADLASIADAWAPYRTWVAVLIRLDREESTGEIARGRRRR